MLRCHQDGKGIFVYHCPKCKESWIVSNGCNSRICSKCGKRYADRWAKRVSAKMFNVTHRHLVLTVPDIVWYILRGNKKALKTHLHVFMTEGGFNKSKKFIPKEFIKYEVMRKTWQYHVLTELRKVLPKTEKYKKLIDACFKKYPNVACRILQKYNHNISHL